MRAVLSIGILLVASPALMAEENPLTEKAKSAGKDVQANLDVGHLYVEAMQLRKAKLSFKQAKWRDMKNPEVRIGMIRTMIAEENFRPAKGACRKVERDHPKKGTGFICSGWYWLANRRPSRAAEEFEKAIALGDVARGKTGLGDCKRLQAEWDAAVALYTEALAAGAGYQAQLGLGLTLERKGDGAGAREALKKAAELEPASCQARFHYGRLLEKGAEAETELRTALTIRPKWFDAMIELGRVYDRSERFGEAEAMYQQATSTDPKRAEGFLGLGKAQYGLGKLDEALVSLNKLAELIPNNVDAYLLAAEIHFAKDNVDEAIEALDRARGVAPSDVSVFIKAARIFFHAKRYTNASVYLNQALTMRPKMSEAHAMLAEISCSRKLYDDGRKHYQKALKGDLKGVSKSELQKKLAQCKK